jgi:hypothetical protein
MACEAAARRRGEDDDDHARIGNSHHDPLISDAEHVRVAMTIQ